MGYKCFINGSLLEGAIKQRLHHKNPAFYKDHGDFVGNHSIPKTANNSRILNYPHRPQIHNQQFELPFKSAYNGIPVIDNGIIKITETGRDFNGNVRFARGRFNYIIKNVSLRNINFPVLTGIDLDTVINNPDQYHYTAFPVMNMEAVSDLFDYPNFPFNWELIRFVNSELLTLEL